MSLILSLLAQILHAGLMIAAAPTVAGVTDWLDARLSAARLGGTRLGRPRPNGAKPSRFGFSSRGGPPILLPWRELLRLSRKTPMTLESVSIVARVAPAIGLGATLSAAALVPSFTLGMALSPLADVLVIVSLLAVARIAAGLAALDSGAALPGLAAQNAGARAVLAEPGLMLAVVTVALMGGSFNLDLIIGQQREGTLLPAAASAVALTAMIGLVFAEASVPAGGEDEMFGGTDLALSRMTAWLRRLVWIDLIGGLFFPVGMAAVENGPLAWLLGLAAWGIKLGVFVVGLSAIRTTLGRMPHHRLPDLIGVAALLALLATIMVLASAGMA